MKPNNIKYIVPLFFVFACNLKGAPISEAKEKELKTHFVSQYKQIDPDSRVDSFAFLKLDTITLQRKYVALSFNYMDEWEKQNQLMKIENDLLQKRIQLMRLSKDQENSLQEQTKEEAKQSLDTIAVIEKRAQKAQLKMNYYDSLSKRADSLKPIGYEAICIYRISLRDWTQQLDTAYIILNNNKNIVSHEEFYKE